MTGQPWPARTPALAVISDYSLMVFLSMSLMSMKLWTLAGLGGPLVGVLALQVAAAVLFLVGSVLFFWEETQFAATWMFVVGSLFFCVKPTLRLTREIHLFRAGDTETLADAESLG